MASRAYRGPNDRQPKTISSKTVGAALLPCTFVTEAATAFAAATAFGPNLRLLLDRDFYATPAQQFTATDPLLTAYASGETGVAAVLEPGQTYQIAMAAATYTWGQEVVVAAAGRAAGAASSGVVVGFTRFAGARAAGELGDIEICMPYVKA
jgi:hypothetical protein